MLLYKCNANIFNNYDWTELRKKPGAYTVSLFCHGI